MSFDYKKTKLRSSPYLLVIPAIVFCLEPKLFVKIPILNALFIAGAILLFVALVIFYLRNNKTISTMMTAIVVYRLSFGFQTLLSNGDILMWGYMSLILVNLCALFDCYMSSMPRLFVVSLIVVLATYLTANLLLAILFPEGLFDHLYFIGIRTRVTDVAFPLITLTLLLDSLDGKRISTRSIALIAVAIANILLLWVGTAMAGLVVIIAGIIVLSKLRIYRSSLLMLGVILFSIAITLLVVVFHIQDYFAWFITGVLGKDLTLTYRTDIWANALAIIDESPLFGHGMAEDGAFVEWGTTVIKMRQAHNQWLQLAYDGGLASIVSFIALFYVAGKGLDFSSAGRCSTLLIAVLIAYSVMFTVEIYSYMPYFFILIFVCDHVNDLTKVGDEHF